MSDRPHIVVVAKGGSFWEGGRQYTVNTLEALLLARAKGHRLDVSLLVNGHDDLRYFERFRPALKVCAVCNDVQAPWTLTNRLRWRLKRSLTGAVNPRLDEALTGLGATFAFPARAATLPAAEWIPDFQYRHFPEGSNAAEIAERKREFGEIARVSRTIVLSSAVAEADCHAELPHTVGRTRVLRFRVFAQPEQLTADPLAIVRHYNLPTRFVLVCNLLAPTKNHAVILDALAAISPARRAGIHVVCTGDINDVRNPGFYNGFLARIHGLGLRANISHLGLIPKLHQVQLLRACLSYLQPALFEGWNTGVEEARMMGKPILLSDIPVQREQAPRRSTYFDPRNPRDLADRMARVFFGSEPHGFDPDVELRAITDYAELQLDYVHDLLRLANCRPIDPVEVSSTMPHRAPA